MAKRVRPPPRSPAERELSSQRAAALGVEGAATEPFMPEVRQVPERPSRRRFWQDHEVAWTKVVVVRLVFFGLLAVDAFHQLAHAARYGAGGFNVPQVAWLPLPPPTRGVMVAVYFGLTLAFALIAQGVALPVLMPAAAALYAYGYFASQLDSYQHHYLVCLLLLLWCFVPRAPDPAPARASRDAIRTVRSWALRLILIQLALLYLWAAIAKLDPQWFDGTALRGQVQPGWPRNMIDSLGWDRVAVLVLLTELTIAATVWWQRPWWIALSLGVGLHVGIELVGLEIGLFSYLMIATYLLVVPDGVFHALDRGTRAPLAPWGVASMLWLLAGGVLLVAALALSFAIPIEHALPTVLVTLVVAAVMVRALLRGDPGGAGRAAVALAVALALPLVLARTTDTLLDHYRYWAGASRRLGDERAARAGYDGMLAIDSSSEYAHYYLGALEADAGKVDVAIAHYHAGQKAAPRLARSFLAEARLVSAQGDLAGAQQLVRDALAADPEDADALALQKSLSGLAPAEGPDPARPPTLTPVPPSAVPPSGGADGGH